MVESKTKVLFDITCNAIEYIDYLQGVGYNKPIIMSDLYNKIMGWTEEFCELDLGSEYPDNDYDFRVVDFTETKICGYLLPSLEDIKMWSKCLGYKVIKAGESIRNINYGNELGRLVLLAKGSDRSLRQYAEDCGHDVAILSKIIAGKYIPKNFKAYEKLASKSARPRNGITANILWDSSLELQKELLSD